MKDLKAVKHMILKERHITVVPTGEDSNERLAATAIKNLEDLGYALDKEGYNRLKTASKEDITDWYKDISLQLNEMSGGNHQYKPFYPNFPEEVMNKNEFELFIDKISHYFFGYRPDEANNKENTKSLEEHDLQVLNSLSGSDEQAIKYVACDIFKNYLKTKSNLSRSMIDSIAVYIDNYSTWPDDAHTVTNRQLLCALYLIAAREKKNADAMPRLVTNDYLRIAAINHTYSDSHGKTLCAAIDELNKNKGGINNIKSLPRAMRRFIIKGLDSQANLEEDVARNKNQFKVLFKLLHVNEYDHITTDQLQDVVRKLRNNERLDTYYSKVEKAFENEDIKTAIRLLKSRPGEFVKNINRLMSLKFEKEKDVKDIYKALLSACRETFPKTRPEDLCRLIQYMNSRMREYKMNVHNVKGRMILDDKHVLHALKSDLAGKIINEAKSAIASQLAADKDYGKVYIEDNMYKMVVPANMKDMSEASNTYTRGSRIPIEKDEDGNVKNIRFSIWWTNTMEERVDMDLSAKYHKFRDMVDENEKHTMFVDEACDNPQVLGVSGGLSYASTFKDTGCYHSGDITNGGDYNGVGATEYIDIDITALKEDGVKFVQFYINSYEGQPFDTVDHCEFAIQERNELTMSQQFDIKAVKQHAKLTSKTCGCIPCVLDVENGELIWTDTAEYHVKRLSNVFSKGISTGFQVLMDDVYYSDRLSMGELAKIAVGANNGVFVDNPKEADTLFMVDNYDEKTKGQRIITSKDIDVWLGEFMSPQNQEEYPDEPEKEISSDECATSIIDAADKGILDDLLDDEENLLSEAGDEQTK